jgi:hypothetical protein
MNAPIAALYFTSYWVFCLSWTFLIFSLDASKKSSLWEWFCKWIHEDGIFCKMRTYSHQQVIYRMIAAFPIFLRIASLSVKIFSEVLLATIYKAAGADASPSRFNRITCVMSIRWCYIWTCSGSPSWVNWYESSSFGKNGERERHPDDCNLEYSW